MSDMRLDSVDGLIRKLEKARQVGVNMVMVWRPDYTDDTTQEDLPDIVACNFDNPQLAAALLGQAPAEASADDAD